MLRYGNAARRTRCVEAVSFYFVQALNGLSHASTLFLIASGLTIVFGVTRITNFAHGSFAMVGAYLATTLVAAWGGADAAWLYLTAIMVAACLVGVLGMLLEVTVLRRLYRASELLQLLATFAVVLIVQDGVLAFWGPDEIFAPRMPGLKGTVEIAGEFYPQYHLFIIACGPVVWAGLWCLFHRTRFGVYVRAATADRDMAAALGVRQGRLFAGVLFLGAFLAALGAGLQLPVATVNLQMDMNVVVEAFAVVVIGGMGSITGAALASLIIGQLHAFGIWLLPEATLVLMFAVMAAVLILRPAGLFSTVDSAGAGTGVRGGSYATGMLDRRAVGLLVLALMLPWLLGDYARVILTEMLIFAVFAISLQWLIGQGGLVSFGHAAFFGFGAYVAALASTRLGAGMVPAMVLAPMAAALLAGAFAFIALRSSGVYLAMLTLAFAQILWSAAMQWVAVTGGDNGLLGVWPDTWMSDRTVYYYFTLAVGTAVVLSMRHLRHARLGFDLIAARDAPLRAEASGISVRLAQWQAFVVSGALAGLAGALMVFHKGSVFPQALSIPTSVDALLMVLLGGVDSLAGAVIGAAAFHGLQTEVARLTDLWRLVVGVVMLALVLLFPDGIAGAWQRWRAPR